jgi:hypothetical protein
MIGNRTGECKACGAFARRAPKRLLALFAEKYPDLYLEFRTQAEYEVYSEIVEEFRETMAKEGILV